jgi:3-methylfumaryl-CoA hydratase
MNEDAVRHYEEPMLEDAGFASHEHTLLDEASARRLAACIDADASVLDEGTLPILWHWAYFVTVVPTAALGPDGHPRRRAEMAAFPRRMFAGGRVRVHAPLRLGESATRTSAVVASELKEGSTGRFWLVTVRHTIRQRDAVALDDEQDFVLRAPAGNATPGVDRDDAPAAPWVELLTPDAIHLFRFSAVTYNAHRIHYDRPYATGIEGYPDLVVHGPLVAVLLAELARRRSGRSVHAASFRARQPLYADRRLWLTGSPAGDTAELAAIRGDHAVAFTLTAELERSAP